MLIEFRVENHRSIRDEQAITMEASLLEDATDARPRAMAGNEKKLLPVAALYGANASGKTNVLSALGFMGAAVQLSQRSWAVGESIPRKPFGWAAKRSEPSEFVIQFLLQGVRYEYGFVTTDEAFIEEWLFAWPNGRKQVWFERDEGVFKFGENLKGENRVIEELTRPNSLYLSAAAQNAHDQLTPVYSWFQNVASLNIRHQRAVFQGGSTTKLQRMFISESRPQIHATRALSTLERFRTLLRDADLGIVDVRMQLEERWGGVQPRFELLHGSDANAWLPLDEESNGTQTFFWLAPRILDVIDTGGVLVVDELEASLHPMLAAQIVRQFNDPTTNPKNAQLIFTTHDTNLLGKTLGEPLFRRDQVWFTEKDKDGATVVYPLTDYIPRKEENLERGYLQGRYGAIPFLGRLQLAGGGE